MTKFITTLTFAAGLALYLLLGWAGVLAGQALFGALTPALTDRYLGV